MSPLALEWIEKAEEDFTVAQREFRARVAPAFGAICFHAQQCAEKYLKARLHAEGKNPERTHNLVLLLKALVNIDGSMEILRPAATLLVDYAVRYRYPGAKANRSDAKAALNHAKLVREIIRGSLGLPIELKRRRKSRKPGARRANAKPNRRRQSRKSGRGGVH
jgi:HEPN domain-containing protein